MVAQVLVGVTIFMLQIIKVRTKQHKSNNNNTIIV
jgi:hypothetical protein